MSPYNYEPPNSHPGLTPYSNPTTDYSGPSFDNGVRNAFQNMAHVDVTPRAIPWSGIDVPMVTKLPSNPNDQAEVNLMVGGQQVYGTNENADVVWRMVYRKVPNRWSFIGGSPLRSEKLDNDNFTLTSYANGAPAGPWIVVPYAGTYQIHFGALASHDTASGFGLMSPSIDGATALDTNGIVFQTAANYNDHKTQTQRITVTSTSVAVNMQYRNGSGAGNLLFRGGDGFGPTFMELTPRLGEDDVMASAWSQALRDQPGMAPRPASTTYSPTFPGVASIPSVPSIGGPNAATRDWLLQQLGPLSQQNNANLTNIQAGAKMQLAGYGGYSFGVDNPATAIREDLNLAFDPKSGPGQREGQAMRAEDNAANARGLLYSSFANQNKASALQRLSLEAQQIANQYAFNLNQQHTAYAGQVSAIAGQWVSLYGQDNQWLAENPPAPPPPPPDPAAAAALSPGVVQQNVAGAGPRGGGGPETMPAGYRQVWIGQNAPSRAKIQALNAEFGNNWSIVVLQGGRHVVYARAA